MTPSFRQPHRFFAAVFVLIAGAGGLSAPVLSRDKNVSPPAPGHLSAQNVPDDAWLSREELVDLFRPGTFWCMMPVNKSCHFALVAEPGQTTELSYEIIGLWDEATLLHDHSDAWILDDGSMCDHDSLNLKRITVTDLDGNPVKRKRLRVIFDEIKSQFLGFEHPDRCYRYARIMIEGIAGYAQFNLTPDGKLSDPMEFLVDFSENAAADYSFW